LDIDLNTDIDQVLDRYLDIDQIFDGYSDTDQVLDRYSVSFDNPSKTVKLEPL
jgi:hypothetical protein